MIYDSSALPEELEILKREFELKGINLNMHDWINSKLVLEEIRFVLIPRIHEGACYSYGVVFANNADDLEDHSIIRMNTDSIHLASMTTDQIPPSKPAPQAAGRRVVLAWSFLVLTLLGNSAWPLGGQTQERLGLSAVSLGAAAARPGRG